MEDSKILELFFRRQESAIEHTREKYGAYCASLAGNILDRPEDVEEVLNDTWLRAWNSIPPQMPTHLKLYLARIARNLAFDRFRSEQRLKRGGGEVTLALEELKTCLPASAGPETLLEAKELQQCVNRFLATLPQREREIFLLRYFHVKSMDDIARQYRLSQSGVRTVLMRTRRKLKDHLKKEEYLHE